MSEAPKDRSVGRRGVFDFSRWCLCAGTFLFAASCGDRTAPGEGVQVTEADSSGVTLVSIIGDVSNPPVWHLSEEPVAVVSGDGPPYLASIGEVGFLGDGSFLVEDNQADELHLFDPRGNLVRLVGGPGEGPGEFRNLTELNVMPGDTFFTYDRRLYRITMFDPEGEVVKTVALTREDGGIGTLALDAWGFGTDRFLLHRMGPWDSATANTSPVRDQRDAVLLSLDGEGQVDGFPVRFTGGYSIQFDGGDAGSPFANEPFVEVNSRSLVFGSALDYELTIAPPDLGSERIIRWAGWKRPLLPETVQRIRGDFEAGWAEVREVQPTIVDNLTEALFSPQVLPDTLPALGSVFLDETGRMWVSRFLPTVMARGSEDHWHILDGNGHPLARVETPPGLQIAAVRGDLVALIHKDSLDVEHLRVHQLLEEGRRPDA